METNDDYALYLIAAPEEAADGLAHALVAEGAAACAQVTGPVTSHYVWDGRQQRETERLILVKTRREKREAVERIVAAGHPYRVPELIEIPLGGGSGAYLRWIDAVLARPQGQ